MSDQQLSRWERPQRPNGQELSQRVHAAQLAAQRCPCQEHDRLLAQEMANEVNGHSTFNAAFYRNAGNTQNNYESQYDDNRQSTENNAYYSNAGNRHSTAYSQQNDHRAINNSITINNNNTFNSYTNTDNHSNNYSNNHSNNRSNNSFDHRCHAPQTTHNASAYLNVSNHDRSRPDMGQQHNTDTMPPASNESAHSRHVSQRPPSSRASHTSSAPTPYKSPLRVRDPRPVKQPTPNNNFLYGKYADYSKHSPPKEDTMCHVVGCKQHRVHRRIPVTAKETMTDWHGGGKTTIKQGDLKIKSLFCGDHTCRSGGAGNGGRFCQNACYPEDRRCSDCVAKGKME